MSTRLLHAVVDELLIAIGDHPQLAHEVLHFLFEDEEALRSGLTEIRTRQLPDTRHADGSVSFDIGVELFASRQLLEFAAAVSAGIVPEMALPCGG